MNIFDMLAVMSFLLQVENQNLSEEIKSIIAALNDKVDALGDALNDAKKDV